MSAIAAALGLSTGLFAIGLVCYVGAALVKSRSLPPNGLIGIRTRATCRSTESWFAGHDAARPVLVAAAVVGICGAAITVVVGVALGLQCEGDGPVLLVAGSLYVVVLALLTWATVRAHKAARRVGPDHPSSSTYRGGRRSRRSRSPE